MVAFTLPHQERGDEDHPKSSWVFSSKEGRLGWLALQAGLRPLSISLSAYTDKAVAFLDPIMFGQGRAGWREIHRYRRLDIVPETWIRAFKLNRDRSVYGSNVTKQNGIFGPALIVLAVLRGIHPPQSMILFNWVLLLKIHGELRTLLYNKDARAMWLVGYWLGLMCRYKGIWWCERRVRRDYEAVRMWLQGLQLGERAGIEELYWEDLMQHLDNAPFLSQTKT
ncbi:hypothetical protein IFR04_004306 [Cadophora malorum]|uniref:Uncharacterized protein n=1 Tax=Cadophora malorum TaxID=108018 RepID=A0A8H7WCX2_9HELO|nr:hypothetical protein IFR04_004306 [Cadophora malorum]